MLKPILVCLWILAAIVATSEETATVLEIAGDVETPLHLTAEDLKALPRGSARVTTSDGLEVSYEGVFLHDILRRAGVPLGEGLRGKALASYVLAEAEDVYQVVFSLAELDPLVLENEVLVADGANGKPLSGRDGKLRIVTPREKRGARSVRMLKQIRVVRLRK